MSAYTETIRTCARTLEELGDITHGARLGFERVCEELDNILNELERAKTLNRDLAMEIVRLKINRKRRKRG